MTRGPRWVGGSGRRPKVGSDERREARGRERGRVEELENDDVLRAEEPSLLCWTPFYTSALRPFGPQVERGFRGPARNGGKEPGAKKSLRRRRQNEKRPNTRTLNATGTRYQAVRRLLRPDTRQHRPSVSLGTLCRPAFLRS